MDRLTDGQGDSYIPPQTLFVGGIIRELAIQTSIIVYFHEKEGHVPCKRNSY
jgi:hypothetical protein